MGASLFAMMKIPTVVFVVPFVLLGLIILGITALVVNAVGRANARRRERHFDRTCNRP
jgi:hypothetical protein